ncbi:MAG: hypothetical protein AAF985_08630 [Bacteroidota bacterium]
MQKLNLLLICCTFLLALPKGQSQISEDLKSMSLGVNNALVLELPDAKEKFVEKQWKKYIKQYDGKTKRNKKADEYYTENAEIVDIGGANPVDVYCRMAESGSDVDVILWIEKDGEFISSSDHPEEYTEAEKILMRFALDVTREKIKIEIKEEENKLKKLNKKLKKLERANANYHRSIEVAKEKIRKNEANIEQNEVDQDDTRTSIEAQMAILEAVKKRLSDL